MSLVLFKCIQNRMTSKSLTIIILELYKYIL